MADAIQLFGTDARYDVFFNHIQNFGGKAARHSHFFDFCWCFDGNAHGYVKYYAPTSLAERQKQLRGLLNLSVHGIKVCLIWQQHTLAVTSSGVPKGNLTSPKVAGWGRWRLNPTRRHLSRLPT